MFRFLVTGACTVFLTATSFAIGGAAETALPPAVTVATAAADAAPASQAASIHAAAIEAVAPTAGADLAMWGVDPSTQPTPAESRLSGRRFVGKFFAETQQTIFTQRPSGIMFPLHSAGRSYNRQYIRL